jgi:hypothetical protein
MPDTVGEHLMWFLTAFFGGLGWALAHWLVNRVLR